MFCKYWLHLHTYSGIIKFPYLSAGASRLPININSRKNVNFHPLEPWAS